jgi:hypothetical protein
MSRGGSRPELEHPTEVALRLSGVALPRPREAKIQVRFREVWLEQECPTGVLDGLV